MVLLKNDNGSLPLKSSVNIALFGNHGYELIAGGTGSGSVNKAYSVTLEQGLHGAGYKINQELKDTYINYIKDYRTKHPIKGVIEEFMHPSPPMTEYVFADDVITQQAAGSDIALVVIGRNAGEGADRKLDNDFNLSDTERTMIKNVADAFHAQNKRVVVVLEHWWSNRNSKLAKCSRRNSLGMATGNRRRQRHGRCPKRQSKSIWKAGPDLSHIIYGCSLR